MTDKVQEESLNAILDKLDLTKNLSETEINILKDIILNARRKERSLSYQLGYVLIHSKKDLSGLKQLLAALAQIKLEHIERKRKKNKKISYFEKLYLKYVPQKEFLANDDQELLLAINKLKSSELFENKTVFFEKQNISINQMGSDPILIGDLKAGKYQLTIEHTNENYFENRKSIFIGTGLEQVNYLRDKIDLPVSDRAGLFFYMGSGKKLKDSIIQTFTLILKHDVTNLKLSFFSVKYDGIISSLKIENLKEVEKVANNKNNNSLLEINYDVLKSLEVDYVLYADINLNVVDGSSVWLSSMANVLASEGRLAIVTKENPRHNQILSNIKYPFKLIDPKFVDYNGILSVDQCLEIIRFLDHYSPIQLIVVRGVDVAFKLHETNQFHKRTASYVTDFYQIDENGLTFDVRKVQKLKSIVQNTEHLLVQTDEIRKKIEELTTVKANVVKFLPNLPNNINKFYVDKSASGCPTIKIGYAGKITPTWGVVELFDWVERLQKETSLKVELHIASNKISSGSDARKFRSLIRSKMEAVNAIHYTDFNRDDCLKMLGQMDYIWCWRPAMLENNTLELSTKILEAAAIGADIISFPNAINKSVLGEENPLYVKKYEDFKHILENRLTEKYEQKREIANELLSKHSMDYHVSLFKSSGILKPINVINKKILVASHDFKFIDPFISHLKLQGYQVRRQIWEWGGHKNEALLKADYEWADVIFCEWGLANATWYSKHNVLKKPLIVRIHAQEVRERARKFGNNMAWDNISKVIFVSNVIKEKALELWPNLSEEKCCKVPNFILDEKLSFNKEKFHNLDEINLGILGIVPETKRFDRAVELLMRLRQSGKNAKLYVKGHRPESLPFMHAPSRKHELAYYENIYKFISDNQLKDYVIYEGWGNDVNQWYEKIHFILSPSDNESFHYALADGIVAGCYPLVWDWQGVEENYSFIQKKIKNDQDAEKIVYSVIKKSPRAIQKEISKSRSELLSVNSSQKVYIDLVNIINTDLYN